MILYWLKCPKSLLDSRGGNIASTSQWEKGKEFMAICFKNHHTHKTGNSGSDDVSCTPQYPQHPAQWRACSKWCVKINWGMTTITRIVLEFMNSFCLHSNAGKGYCYYPHLIGEIEAWGKEGNQPWILVGRTDAEAEAEAPILWLSDAKSLLIGNDPDTGKDWR